MAPLTIALTRYNEPNWLLWETLDSLAAQEGIDGEVLVLDQVDDAETAARVAELTRPGLHFRWTRIPARSLSYARNQAVRIASHPVILFVDSDAVAEPGWAVELAATLARTHVAVAGGRILPRWHRRPLLIARAQVVWEQYSLFDQGTAEREVSKVIGAGFGMNRERLGEQAYFDENLGRREGVLLGGEETDLCERARRAGFEVSYNGRAVVHHNVLPERIRYRWILKRIYFAGVSRALRGGGPSPTHELRAWDLVFMPLIAAVYGLGYLRVRFGAFLGGAHPHA